MEFMMSKFISAVKTFVKDEQGVTAIEYSLIAAVIGVGIMTVLTPVSTAINAEFQKIVTALS
jgi:pilus assembly protein Flp/PilA